MEGVKIFFTLARYMICFILVLTVIADVPQLSPELIDSLDSILITFGKEADPHSVPFMALLNITSHHGGTSLCGGALISANYVITAGHCVRNAFKISVSLGVHNISATTKYQVKVPADTWTAYDDKTSVYDLAVIKLQDSVQFNEGVQPATLPLRSDFGSNYVGLTGRVYGWGLTENYTASQVLLYSDMPVVANDVCQKPESFICAAKINSSGTCKGDSGGPFVVNTITVGLVHGSKCAYGDLQSPSVFTKLNQFLDWIEDNTDVLIS